jgi:hypothetical protein
MKNLNCLVFLCFLLPSTFFAASVKNIKSGNWSDNSIWDSGVMPNKFDKVTITGGTDVIVTEWYVDCDSLQIDGYLNVFMANLTIGGRELYIDQRAIRNTSVIINGKLRIEGNWDTQFKVYGHVKFNKGSSFEMVSGAMMVDGCGFVEALSVTADKALLDVSEASEFNSKGGVIVLFNPHFHPNGITIKGAKHFYNVTMGNNITLTNFACRSTSDFLISETEKPTFDLFQMAYLPNPNRQNKVVLNNVQLKDLTITKGVLTGGRTKISGLTLLGEDAVIESDIEFNGTSQQRITTYRSNSYANIKGNVFINNPSNIETHLSLNIEGQLNFVQGKLLIENKTITLNRPPVGTSDNKYIVTHDNYWGAGTLQIKNLSGASIFPVGTANAYMPVTLTANGGDFSVSAYPLSIGIPFNTIGINAQWDLRRLAGNNTADVWAQWTINNETGDFGRYRANANLYAYRNGLWQGVGNGSVTNGGSLYGKNAANVSDFAQFTVITTAGGITYDCTNLQKNIGESCDDGNPNTTNDRVQGDCNCKGEAVKTYDCPTIQKNIGDACDDGNAATTNDRVQANCGCKGDVITTADCQQFMTSNTNQRCNPTTWIPFGLILNDENFQCDNVVFQRKSDGTAVLKGYFRDIYWKKMIVNISLSNLTKTATPTLIHCTNSAAYAADWQYYTQWSGTIERENSTPLSISTTSNFQFGLGANTEDLDQSGAYGSFTWADGRKGVLAFKLSSASVCQEVNLKDNNTTTSKPEALTTNTLSVFPNPSDGRMLIRLTDNFVKEKVSISLINMVGYRFKEVQSAGIRYVPFEVEDVPNGIYMIKVSQVGKRDMVKQVVIQR